jgi:uncharacterized protein YndB with AHSA1/START domain
MRQHETIIEIPASVEEVWKAITEASEIRRWFAPEVRIDLREGGEYFLSWGPGMEGAGKIEIVDAPNHLRMLNSRGQVQDFYIEGHGGGATLRLVHSGFLDTADWDAEFNGTRDGWPIFFRMLHYGLTRHRGVPGRNIDLYSLANEPMERAWELAAPLRPAVVAGEKPPVVAWWVWPEQNDALVHFALMPYGPKTGVWVNVATFGLSDDAVEAIRSDWKQRLQSIFPEQTPDICA